MSNIRHTVKSGETLARIAKKHHVTIDAILAVNPALRDPDVIFAGQIILVPVDEPLPGETAPPQPPPTTTPVRGFDASERITSGAACFRNAGFHFAIRYYNIKNSNQLPTKRLILAEARALVQAGFQLGAVFQQGGRAPESFTHGQGLEHGQVAHQRAADEIRQPAGSTIYFAVDFDATQSQIAANITSYFRGVDEGLATANGGTRKYEVGVYGSGATCSALLAANLVTFTWLSQSSGFSGSKEFAKHKRYNLIQFMPQDVCGFNIDPDETNPGKPSGLFTIPTT